MARPSHPPRDQPPPPSLVLHGRAALVVLADAFAGAGPSRMFGPDGRAFVEGAVTGLNLWYEFADRLDADAVRVDRKALWRELRSTTPDLADFESLTAFQMGLYELIELLDKGAAHVGLAPPSADLTPAPAAVAAEALQANAPPPPTPSPPSVDSLLHYAAMFARESRCRDRVKAALRSGDGDSLAGDGRGTTLLSALAVAGREAGPEVQDAAVAALLIRKLQALEKTKR